MLCAACPIINAARVAPQDKILLVLFYIFLLPCFWAFFCGVSVRNTTDKADEHIAGVE